MKASKEYILEKLKEIHSSVLSSEYCDFYKKFYTIPSQKNEIRTIEDWERLKILQRIDIQDTPFWNKIFVPKGDVDSFRMSSGTSGNTPIISPKLQTEDTEYFMQRTGNPTAILNFMSHPHAFLKSFLEDNNKTPILFGDYAHIAATMRLSATIQIDCIVTFVFMLPMLYVELGKNKLLHKIRCVVLCGELTTESELNAIKSRFPNAKLVSLYMSSELSSTAGFTALNALSPNILNPAPPFFWEVVDEKNIVLTEPGAEGTLLVTTLPIVPLVFPYLRYNTGDTVRIEKISSDTHWNSTYRLLGRKNLNTISLAGGVLTIDEVERVLTNIHPAMRKNYILHYYRGSKPRIEIHIHTENILKKILENPEKVAEKISNNLRLGPKRTYSAGVQSNLYSPLTVKVIPVCGNSLRWKKTCFILH